MIHNTDIDYETLLERKTGDLALARSLVKELTVERDEARAEAADLRAKLAEAESRLLQKEQEHVTTVCESGTIEIGRPSETVG